MNNYGPDKNLRIRWEWSHTIRIQPKQSVIYRFSFRADHENAVIVYSLPDIKPLVERGNHSRSTEDWEFYNDCNETIEHLITGWCKSTPPDSEEPWYHSPKYIHPSTEVTDVIGFADDQKRDTPPIDPDLFQNALVTVVYR